jgi:serine O-acetyltransferase
VSNRTPIDLATLRARIRASLERHGGSLRDRAVWALAIYHFGVWSANLESPRARWLTSKIYGLLNVASEIVTGVTMTRDVRVGDGFHIIHAATIFIHPRVVIGDRVGIMHNVTIGTNMGSDVPVIGNDVFIGAGASILGKVRVGDGARIAANSLVINDVPAGASAVGVPAKNMRLRVVKPEK